MYFTSHNSALESLFNGFQGMEYAIYGLHAILLHAWNHIFGGGVCVYLEK